jgi:hypothetical protein
MRRRAPDRSAIEEALAEHQVFPVAADAQAYGTFLAGFCEYANILHRLTNPQWEVIYGAPGTGKTTTLRSLQERLRLNLGDNPLVATRNVLPVYVSAHDAASVAVLSQDWKDEEKASAIFQLFLEAFGQELARTVRGLRYRSKLFRRGVSKKVDGIINEILDVVGNPDPLYYNKTVEEDVEDDTSSGRKLRADLDLGARLLGGDSRASAGASGSSERRRSSRRRAHRRSVTVPRLNKIRELVLKLIEELSMDGMFILIDDWSAIDGTGTTGIQPAFGEYLYSAFGQRADITVKVATDGYQTRFYENGRGLSPESRIFEAANLNEAILDHEVFIAFFEQMLFTRMIKPWSPLRAFRDPDSPASAPSEAFVDSIFSERSAFELLVQGCEGRPRQFFRTFNHLALTKRNSIERRWTTEDVLAALESRHAIRARDVEEQSAAVRLLLLAVQPRVTAQHHPLFVMFGEHAAALRPLLNELRRKSLIFGARADVWLPKRAQDRVVFRVDKSVMLEWERAAAFERELAGNPPATTPIWDPEKLRGDEVEEATLTADELAEWLEDDEEDQE